MRPSLIVADTVKRQHIAKKSVVARNRRVKLFCFLIFFGLCLLLAYVWTRIQVVQRGYEVSRLHKEADELIKSKSLLEAEVAKLKSPARLESIARKQLGMRLPHGDEVVLVEP